MAWVVFLRAVNVGGHQKFQPSVLAKKLVEFDVVNVGAAGTFVVRKAVSQATLRTHILRWLPFKPEMMICAAREIIALVDVKPFGDTAPAKGRAMLYPNAAVEKQFSIPATTRSWSAFSTIRKLLEA